MEIKIKKGNTRNQLICIRPNGTVLKADLGPTLPFHDIAHFVVENNVGLSEGFYGNILKGYSVEQLSDKQVVKTLGLEALFSEIAARALQSLSYGACIMEQFLGLIKDELHQFSANYHFNLTEERIIEMKIEYKRLLDEWRNLSEGEVLELHFSVNRLAQI